MSLCCPVCYEDYLNNKLHIIPRKLLCGDVVCEKCILHDLIDNLYYCPECGSEQIGTLNDISTSEVHINDSFEEDKRCSGNSTSYSINPTSTVMNRMDKRSSVKKSPCKIKGCSNKSIAFDLCLVHAKHHHQSLHNAVERLTLTVSNSKLSFDGDEIRNLSSPPSSSTSSLDPDVILENFRKQNTLLFNDAVELLDAAKSIMLKEPNILRIDAPVIAVGDIHGQFYDLLNIFSEGGRAGIEPYLFLGDYVDRGSFSCEVMLLLVALKVKYPDKIWLLRGNHECSSVSGHFGFKQECKVKYGVNVYYKFLLLFQTMPLAAIVSTAYGDIFCVHGGLSPSLRTIDQIEALDRFIEPENSPILDILWSDPINEDQVEDMTDAEYYDFMEIDWRSNPTRGCSYCFGYKALIDFLDTNKLVCLVRAHEVQKAGFKKHYDPATIEDRMKKLLKSRSSKLETAKPEAAVKYIEGDFPPLITIFSAPHYCDRYDNRGAILKIDMALDGFKIIQYDRVEHPIPMTHESQSENQILAIATFCPYLPSSFKELIRIAIDLGPEDIDSLVHQIDDQGNSNSESIISSVVSSSNDADDNNTIKECAALITESLESSTPVKNTRRISISLQLARGSITSLDDLTALPVDEAASTALSPPFDNKNSWSCVPVLSPPSAQRRRSSISTFQSVVHEVVKNKFVVIDLYNKALANDAINEMHPDKLQLSGTKSDVFLPHLKGMNVSVQDLRKQFEKGISTSLDTVSSKPKVADVMNPSIPLSQLQDRFGGTKQRRHSVAIVNTATSCLSTSRTAKQLMPHKSLSRKSLQSDAAQESSFDYHPDKAGLSTNDSDTNIAAMAATSQQEKNTANQLEIDTNVLFSNNEISALRLMFSFFDRNDSGYITYDDLVAYAEETGDTMGIRDAEYALEIIDLDGDEMIGLLDFFHFAARLKSATADRSIDIVT